MHQSKSPYVIGAIVFAVVVGLGVFLLARTGGGGPAAAPNQSPLPTPSATRGTPTSAPDRDTIEGDEGTSVVEVRITGDCEGCLLTAHQTADPDGRQTYEATVAEGVVSVEVPTPSTYGMYFTLTGTKGGDAGDKATLVLLRPDEVTPGTPVSEPELTSAGATFSCWAGTTLDTAVLRITATSDGSAIRQAWADPALPTVGAAMTPQKAAKANATPNCA